MNGSLCLGSKVNLINPVKSLLANSRADIEDTLYTRTGMEGTLFMRKLPCLLTAMLIAFLQLIAPSARERTLHENDSFLSCVANSALFSNPSPAHDVPNSHTQTQLSQTHPRVEMLGTELNKRVAGNWISTKTK